MLRPRSQKDFHAHFSYDGDASCTSNLSVVTAHVIELEGKELPLRPLVVSAERPGRGLKRRLSDLA